MRDPQFDELIEQIEEVGPKDKSTHATAMTRQVCDYLFEIKPGAKQKLQRTTSNYTGDLSCTQ